ncbi:MAG TPA: class I SAM-dependent methyltransferase [Myxococcota bacterium]|nr:class I SAM-dependent methyltransferase [Myxococcota bacterium]
MGGGSSSEDAGARERRLHEVVAAAQAFDAQRVADTVIWRLDLAPADAVLELGCGSGRTLMRVASRVPRGFVAAVEPSELMLRHARLRARGLERSGRLRLVHGSTADLSALAEARFDKAFGIHLAPLLREPRHELAEIRRVLRPGGRLLLGYRPAGESSSRGAAFPAARLEALLVEGGFRDVRTERTIEAGPLLAFTRATR